MMDDVTQVKFSSATSGCSHIGHLQYAILKNDCPPASLFSHYLNMNHLL